MPRVAGVVASHHVPVLLHEEYVRAGRVHRDPVNAVPDLPVLVRQLTRAQPAVDREPSLAAVVGAKGAGRRDRDEHSLRIVGVDEDRVQAQPARAGLPLGARRMISKTRQLLPCLASVDGAEERRVFDAGVHRVGISQRRLEVPDAGELPGVLCAVVPLMRAGDAVVGELVADGFPRRTPVVRALDDLAMPPGGLRRVQPIRIGR